MRYFRRIYFLVFCFFAMGILIPSMVMGADTGLKSPSLSVAGGQFTNPDNAFSSNNFYATAGANNLEQQYSDFGFLTVSPVIPSGATILGIEVQVEAYKTGTKNLQLDVKLSWGAGGAGTWSAPRTTAAITTTEQYYSVGSATDLWGRAAWSVNDFSNGNFRVWLQTKVTGSGGAPTMYLDHVRVKVYYGPPAPQLVSPSNGATVTTATVALDWNDVTYPSAVEYQVQVDNNADYR